MKERVCAVAALVLGLAVVGQAQQFTMTRHDCVSELVSVNSNRAISPWGNWVFEKVGFPDDSAKLYLFPVCDTVGKLLLTTVVAEAGAQLSLRIDGAFGHVEGSTWDPLQRTVYFRVRGSTINVKAPTAFPKETDYDVFGIDVSELCAVAIPGLEYTPYPSVGKRQTLEPNEARVWTVSRSVPGAAAVRIQYGVTVPGPVSVGIYSAEGRLVRRLRQDRAEAGQQSLWWDKTDTDGRVVSPGSYYYQIEAAGARAARVLLLVE